MFKDDDFKIYKLITKKYAVKNIHDVIETFNKRLLKIRKILNQISKNRYYDIAEATTE